MQNSAAGEHRYFVYLAAFNGARAYVNSTAILYLVDVAGLPLAATALLLAADLIATMLAEIPTGIYADQVGRHRSFVMACGLTCCGFVLYAALPLAIRAQGSLLGLTVLAATAEAIGSVGFAFQSGALDAWIISRFQAAGRTAQVKALLAQGQTVKNIAYMIAGIAGIAHYYLLTPALPVFSTFLAAAVLLFFLTLFAMRHDKLEMATPAAEASSTLGSRPIRTTAALNLLVRAGRDVLANTRLQLLILAGVATYTFIQLLAYYWPYLLLKQFSTASVATGAWGLTLSWLVGYGFRALGNHAARVLNGQPARVAHALVASVVAGSAVTFFLCWLAGFVNSHESGVAWVALATLLYGLIRFSDGFADPLRQWLISEIAEPGRLATIYSVASFLALGVSALVSIGVADQFDRGTPLTAMLILAAVFQLVSAPFYLYSARR